MVIINKKKKQKNKWKCHYGPTNRYIISSPVGEILLTCCQYGLHSLVFRNHDNIYRPNYDTPMSILRQMWCDNGYTYKPVLQTLDWLKIYFHYPELLHCTSHPQFCKVIETKKGSIQDMIVMTLVKIPFGNVVTYKDLVKTVGKDIPRTALLSVIKMSPIHLIIPYHRVICKNEFSDLPPEVRNNLLSHEQMLHTN